MSTPQSNSAVSTRVFTISAGAWAPRLRRGCCAGLTAGLLLAGVASPRAQELLPREDALKAAFIVSVNLKDMLQTPIPTDPDVKRPVAVHDGDYGGMVLPESKLSAETIAQAGKEVRAVGQLWMTRLVPVNGDEPVPLSKFRVMHFKSEDHEADAICCALGVRKDANGALELLVYGRDKEPVLRAPLKAIATQQENPIEVSAERRDNGGVITLKLAGKFEASFMVTDPER